LDNKVFYIIDARATMKFIEEHFDKFQTW